MQCIKIASSIILKYYDSVRHGTRPERNNALKKSRLQCVKYEINYIIFYIYCYVFTVETDYYIIYFCL